MNARLYFFPILHCPALCPYKPPRQLLGDDYDPAREEAAWKFCGDHCWLSREDERPCLIARDQSQAHHTPHAAA